MMKKVKINDKRDAEVGEYIKIVNAVENKNKHGRGLAYKNNDILKVKEACPYGNVTVNTLEGKGSNLDFTREYNFIYKKEYVVLENYEPM